MCDIDLTPVRARRAEPLPAPVRAKLAEAVERIGGGRATARRFGLSRATLLAALRGEPLVASVRLACAYVAERAV